MSIGTVTNHHDAADGFAFTIQPNNAAAHVRTKPNIRHIAQKYGHAFIANADRDFFQVVEAVDVAFDVQDEFSLGEFQRASADFSITALDGRTDVLERKVV